MAESYVDIMNYIREPQTLWTIVFMGAVATLGLSEFFKCWIRRKALIKWTVFFTSLAVGFIMSPLVPTAVTAVVITWLLILAVAVLAHRTILDGIPNIIAKALQSQPQNDNPNPHARGDGL